MVNWEYQTNHKTADTDSYRRPESFDFKRSDIPREGTTGQFGRKWEVFYALTDALTKNFFIFAKTLR